MSVSLTGVCNYVSTLGSTLEDRTAFDGSVPYSISTSVTMNFNNTDSSAHSIETWFSLNGSPAQGSVTGSGTGSISVPSFMKTVLTKDCSIRLRDVYVYVPDTVTNFFVNVYVGDPTQYAPSVSTLNTHLSFHNSLGGIIKIPDMDGIIVPAGKNVCVGIQFTVAASSGTNRVAVHSICDIND